MPASPLHSLVLTPVACGAFSVVLACFAGERTDRLPPDAGAADTAAVVAATPAAPTVATDVVPARVDSLPTSTATAVVPVAVADTTRSRTPRRRAHAP